MKKITDVHISKKLVLPVPSDERIKEVAQLLAAKMRKEDVHRRYAPVGHILTWIGVAGLVGLSLISPSAIMIAKPFLDEKRRKERDLWKQYNPSFLKRSIRRLHQQKFVETLRRDGEDVVMLTENGKRRILKYAQNELSIVTPHLWDRRWRMVIYDVDSKKKRLRDVFRTSLKSLGFLQLQKSVWVYPYPCEQQISFLREYYGVGNEVLYVVATTLEDDTPYREYFGLV